MIYTGRMKLASLYSGGKDSSYALWLAMKEGHEIVKMVSIIPKCRDSWMFHKPKKEIMELTSKSAEIPLITKETEGVKEDELADLKHALENLSIDGIVSGALTSSYQKSRLEKICKELGLKLISPLWNKNPVWLIENIISENFEVIITSVSAGGLGEEWLGDRINERTLKKLKTLNKKFGIHISGEGGEYETLVTDAPFFKKKIDLKEIEKIWKGDRGFLEIKKAQLVEK